MNTREKLLAAAVVSVAVIIGGGLGLRAFFQKPLKDIDAKTKSLRQRLSALQSDKEEYFRNEKWMTNLAMRTFGAKLEPASARCGEMLHKQILASGLKETDFSRLPFGPRRLRGAQEIGWSIQGEGPLDQVVNLLFLLEESPDLHRVESLYISAAEAPGWVKVRFRYLTLVLEPAPEVDIVDLEPRVNLAGPERKLYNGIALRDIMRPYVKRPPTPPAPPAPAPGTGSAAVAGASAPGPETYKVVSLSEWQGHPEVHVRDLTQQKTQLYKPGDTLAGGTIIKVDYRALPRPGRGGLLSDSRVIVRVGNDFWAIERGGTLAEKYQLKPDQLPEDLAKK